MKELNTDILIIGGSFGGVSAAIAACKSGCRVILTEETNWIGGQATSQGVPLDEHPWIEHYGSSESYRNFRTRIRDYYKRNYALSQKAQSDYLFNPGACWVSALGFEPRVGEHVLEEMIAPYRTSGLLTVYLNTKPIEVLIDKDSIECVILESIQTKSTKCITAKYFLDATELGDILELGSIESVIGAESQKETGEPLALDVADPLKQQPFTHLISLELREEKDVIHIEKPDSYENFRPVFSKVLAECTSLRAGEIIGNGMPKGLFTSNGVENQYSSNLWNFRRYFYKGNFDTSFFKSDITSMMVGNEYTHGVLCGVSQQEKELHLKGAKDLSLSLVYYLQQEVPYKKSTGIPTLSVSLNTFDTDDGLAKYPYIRESRRIKALFTIKEQDFLISEHPEGPINYFDTVGLAGYRIDIHEKAKNQKDSITSVVHGKHWTQQISLGSLIPMRIKNLIAACKNIGTTHVTNGAYRLHPVEWNIGEVAGSLASFCIISNESPEGVRNTTSKLELFQNELMKRGIELYWPTSHFGMSYFSCNREKSNWYFGECDKIENSFFLNRRKGEKNTAFLINSD